MAWWLRVLVSLVHGLGLVTPPTWQFTNVYINLVVGNPTPCSSLHRHKANTLYTNRQTQVCNKNLYLNIDDTCRVNSAHICIKKEA